MNNILVELIKHFNYLAIDSKKRYNMESLEFLENIFNNISKEKIKKIYTKHKNFTKSFLELRQTTEFMKKTRVVYHVEITSQDLDDEIKLLQKFLVIK